MKLLIKFPTRNRPHKFLKTLHTYMRYLYDKDTEIIVSCDLDDTSMSEPYIIDFVGQYPNVKLHYGDNRTKIEAVNADLTDVDFDILLLASDDMIPIIQDFDVIIKNKMIEHYSDTDGVLWFNDGYQGNRLNTLCILGKKYYDRFNYIYNPEYISVWSDNEFMNVANILGKQTYFDEVIIQHQHPDWGHGTHDVIHTLNSRYETHDKEIYENRRNNNFYL
jgi:hypothetical protein